jgi:thiol-disulfide isomerase/thioredoxin
MNRRLARCALVLLFGWLTISANLPQAFAADIGQPAPAWQATTLDGRVIDSESLKGKVVLVHFWATWCPPCRKEMPALAAFYKQHAKDGFEVIAVSLDEASNIAEVRRFVQSYGFPVAMMDSSRMDGFGRVWALPLSFLIDRKGVLREADWTGERKIDAVSLDKFVLPALSAP